MTTTPSKPVTQQQLIESFRRNLGRLERGDVERARGDLRKVGVTLPEVQK